jgi:hypothetical protein
MLSCQLYQPNLLKSITLPFYGIYKAHSIHTSISVLFQPNDTPSVRSLFYIITPLEQHQRAYQGNCVICFCISLLHRHLCISLSFSMIFLETKATLYWSRRTTESAQVHAFRLRFEGNEDTSSSQPAEEQLSDLSRHRGLSICFSELDKAQGGLRSYSSQSELHQEMSDD